MAIKTFSDLRDSFISGSTTGGLAANTLLEAEAGLRREALNMGQASQLPDIPTNPFALTEAPTEFDVFDTARAARQGAIDGTITGAVGKLATEDREEFKREDFDLFEYIDEDPERKQYVDRALMQDDNPLYENLKGELIEAESRRHVDAILQRYRDQEQALERIDDHPVAYWTGLLGGAVAEFPVLAAIGNVAGAGAAVARVSNAVRIGLFGSKAASPAVTAARSGSALAAIAAGDAYLHSLTDESMDESSILLAAAFGGVLGAGIGGYIGSRNASRLQTLMNARRVAEEGDELYPGLRALDETADDAARAVDDSAGAARVVDEELGLLAARTPLGRAIPILGRIPGLGRLLAEVRSPRSRARQAWAETHKLLKEKGIDLTRVGTIIDNIVERRVLDKSDVAGVARHETVESIMDTHRVMLDETKAQLDRRFDAFLEKHIKPLKDRLAAKAASSGVVPKALTKVPTQADTARLSDLYYQAKGEGDELAVRRITQDFAERVDGMSLEDAAEVLEDIGAPLEKYYKTFGQMEVEVGVLKAEELVPGYRPQSWNAEAMIADPLGAKLMLYKILRREPPEQFWRDFAEEFDGTWDDFIKAEPELASSIQDEWAEAMDALRAAGLEIRVEEALWEARKFAQDVAVDEMLTRTAAELTALETRIQKAQARLQSRRLDINQDDPTRTLAKVNERRKKTERQIAKWQARVQQLKDDRKRVLDLMARVSRTSGSMNASDDALFELLLTRTNQKQGTRRVAGLSRDTQKQLSDKVKAAQKVDEEVAAKLADKTKRASFIVDQLYKALTKNEALGGAALTKDNILFTSNNWKRRSLNLKGMRDDPEVQKFLNTNTEQVLGGYTRSTSPHIALRQKFVPTLMREGFLDADDVAKLKDADMPEKIREYARDQMNAERLRLRDEVVEGTITKEQMDEALALGERKMVEYDQLLERLLKRATGSDVLEIHKTSRRVASIGTDAVTASMLGQVIFSALPDAAIALFAGGRLTTGFMDFLRIGRNKAHFERLLKTEEGMEFIQAMASGRHMEDMNRLRDVGLDEIEEALDVPGSLYHRIKATSSSVATLSMRASLLHAWSMWLRRAGGRATVRQLGKDLADFEGLSPQMKTFYARVGIGADEAREMGRLLDAHHVDLDGIRYPNAEKWQELGKTPLLNRYMTAIRRAGDEFLVAPGTFDTPFWARSTIGQFTFQLTSFAFSVGEQWLAPAVQRAAMNKADAGAMFSLAMVVPLSIMGQAARRWTRGEDMDDVLEDPALPMESMVRSPFMLGMSSLAVDALSPMVGPSMNDVIGADVIPESSTRRHFNVSNVLTGPTGGFAQAVWKATQSQEGAVNFLNARIPLVNSALVAAALRSFEGD
jgi:hypothetical protein